MGYWFPTSFIFYSHAVHTDRIVLSNFGDFRWLSADFRRCMYNIIKISRIKYKEALSEVPSMPGYKSRHWVCSCLRHLTLHLSPWCKTARDAETYSSYLLRNGCQLSSLGNLLSNIVVHGIYSWLGVLVDTAAVILCQNTFSRPHGRISTISFQLSYLSRKFEIEMWEVDR